MSRSSVSVIICTRDRPLDLERCLASIAAQTVQPDEVIVVSGSDQSCPAQLVIEFARFPIRVIDCYEHNISKSRNAGLNASLCEVVLFIDDDATACQDWVRLYIDEFETHPKTWAIGGKVFDTRDSPPSVEFDNGVVAPTGLQIPVVDLAAPIRRNYFPNVKGCNFGIRRQEIQSLNGFDEFFAFAYDESDLMMRIYQAGAKVRHLNDATVDHAHTPGHYRAVEPFDHDWRVQYASHTMFVLKHATGFQRFISFIVIARRFAKLIVMLLWYTLSGQIRLKTSFKYATQGLLGISHARSVYRLLQLISD